MTRLSQTILKSFIHENYSLTLRFLNIIITIHNERFDRFKE